MKTKTDVFHVFMKRLNIVGNMLEEASKGTITRRRSLKALRTDNGGEHLSYKLRDQLEHLGIENHRSLPFNLHQKMLAERFNHTPMNIVRSI